MIDRQRLALGGGVETGLVDIHCVVTGTANQSGLVTFDPESGARVTCDVGYLYANFGLLRPLSVLDLGPMYATDVRRHTDVRQNPNHRLMPRLLGARA